MARQHVDRRWRVSVLFDGLRHERARCLVVCYRQYHLGHFERPGRYPWRLSQPLWIPFSRRQALLGILGIVVCTTCLATLGSIRSCFLVFMFIVLRPPSLFSGGFRCFAFRCCFCFASFRTTLSAREPSRPPPAAGTPRKPKLSARSSIPSTSRSSWGSALLFTI